MRVMGGVWGESVGEGCGMRVMGGVWGESDGRGVG